MSKVFARIVIDPEGWHAVEGDFEQPTVLYVKRVHTSRSVPFTDDEMHAFGFAEHDQFL